MRWPGTGQGERRPRGSEAAPRPSESSPSRWSEQGQDGEPEPYPAFHSALPQTLLRHCEAIAVK